MKKIIAIISIMILTTSLFAVESHITELQHVYFVSYFKYYDTFFEEDGYDTESYSRYVGRYDSFDGEETWTNTKYRAYISQKYPTSSGTYPDEGRDTRIWVAGFDDPHGSVLLQYDGTGWNTVYEIVPPPPVTTIPNRLSWIISSVWTDSYNMAFCASTGRLYQTFWDTDGYAEENFYYDYSEGDAIQAAPYPNKVRGNSRNDLFVVGDRLNISHFNGFDWRTYSELSGNGSYYSISTKGDLAVAVGQFYESLPISINRAIIAVGKR